MGTTTSPQKQNPQNFFSSSAWIRREILSLFLSAILISFWRFLINCFPSATNLRTSDGFSTLPSIWVKMLFKCEFTPPRSPSKGQTEKKSLTISNISPSLIFHVWSGKGCYVAWIFRVISLNLFRLLDNTCFINERDLHFSSRLSFFCEYFIILAQRGKIDQVTNYLKT